MVENGLRPADLSRGIGCTKAAAGAIFDGSSMPGRRNQKRIHVWTRGRAHRDEWDDADLEREAKAEVRPFSRARAS